MANAYLGREEAPIGAETWKLIDDVAVQAAKSQITGRGCSRSKARTDSD